LSAVALAKAEALAQAGDERVESVGGLVFPPGEKPGEEVFPGFFQEK